MSTITEQGLEVANAITKLHRQYYGRGAASARTVMGRDHLIVFLEDIYTTLERTLIDDGKWQTVRTTRKEFQLSLRDAFVDRVETITGRRVIAFMSEVHLDPDIAAELFVLAPESG